MIEDIPSNIAGSLIANVLNGNDPLTPEDIELRHRMQKSYNSFKFKSAEEYKEHRIISAEDQFKATMLTNTQPLFIPYATELLNRNISFASRIAPILKDLAGNMGLENLADHVFEEMGFKGLPTVIDDREYNNLGGLTLYRGFKSVDEIKQFISGNFYICKWTAGSGVYFTTEKEYARGYTNSDELVLECKLIEQDCKIIENEIIIEAMTIDTEKGNFDLFYDVGIYGAIKGFDVINRIEFGSLTKLILNRGKVIISEKEKNKFS